MYIREDEDEINYEYMNFIELGITEWRNKMDLSLIVTKLYSWVICHL